MKYAIAILLALSTSIWAMSIPEDEGDDKDVQKVYNNLVRANPQVRKVSISVRKGVYSWCTMACNTGDQIIISAEAMSVIYNKAELAGLIGHEMAHDVYDDEMKADLLGLQYAANAGYNRCLAAQLLKGYVKDAKHPSGETRYRNTGCP